MRITVVGLGPAGPELTTPAAAACLGSGPVVLRTGRHPAAAPYLGLERVETFDALYEEASSFEELYQQIVDALLERAEAHGALTYAVPGSPTVAERTVELLRATVTDLHLEVVPGMSFCELAWVRLGIDPLQAGVRLVDAERFAAEVADASGPVLVGQCWSNAVLSSVKVALETPPEHAVLAHHLGLLDEVVAEVDWSEIDRTLEADHLTSLYLPSLGSGVGRELVRLDELIHVLRERCPWDRIQTHESLLRHLLEETYEAIEAIEALGSDPDSAAIAHLEEELGDVLCQVLFHSVIAAEQGWFNLADVARGLADKLVRRHPHVFGDDSEEVQAADVLANWEAAKREEKGRTSLLDGIPQALPALSLTAKLQRRAREALGTSVVDEDFRARVARLVEAVLGGDVAAGGALVFLLARFLADRGADAEELVRNQARGFSEQFLAAERRAAISGVEVRVEFDQAEIGREG